MYFRGGLIPALLHGCITGRQEAAMNQDLWQPDRRGRLPTRWAGSTMPRLVPSRHQCPGRRPRHADGRLKSLNRLPDAFHRP